MYARRHRLVVASASVWYRIVREFNLRRPGIRIYPPKPKIGVRASEPNEIWHLNMSVFSLLDGTKVYIQAVIDNASRYVLAWKVSRDFGGGNTKDLIERALEVASSIGKRVDKPNLFVDSGVENLNKEVDSLIKIGKIARTITQIDVVFSNSMIELCFDLSSTAGSS